MRVRELSDLARDIGYGFRAGSAIRHGRPAPAPRRGGRRSNGPPGGPRAGR